MEGSDYCTPKSNLKKYKKNLLNIHNISPIKCERKLSFFPSSSNLSNNKDSAPKNDINSRKKIKKILSKESIPEEPQNNDINIINKIGSKSGKINRMSEFQKNYFINFTKNIYTNESHLNKSITKNSQNFANNPKVKFAVEKSKSNYYNKINNASKSRRMSCDLFFTPYFNKSKNVDNKNINKEPIIINSNLKSSNKQKTSQKINNILSCKNLTNNEKEFLFNYYNNKGKDIDSTPKYKLEENVLKSPKKIKNKKKNNINLKLKPNKEENEKNENIVKKEVTKKEPTENNINNKIILHNINQKEWKMICLKPFFCCLKTN